MASVVERGNKNLVIYFDHEDSLVTLEWDDVIANPVADLPKVISPRKVTEMAKKDGEKLPDFYSNLQATNHQSSSKEAQVDEDGDSDSGTTDSEDSDYEDFPDSDYEWSDDDDDLFADFVDGDVDDQGTGKREKKAKGSRLKGEAIQRIGDLSSDESELEISDEEQDGVKIKFKTWKEQDRINPTFSVGLVFPSVVELRDAINEYAIRNRVQIKMPRNEKKRIRAHCAEGCSCNLYASEDSRVKAFVVKTYFGEHNCPREWAIKQCTAKWPAGKYIETFRANDKMSLTHFAKTVQKDWNLTPSRSKLARARRIAMKAIYGDDVEQYNKLWDYANEFRTSNPGSTFFPRLEDGLFSQCYVSLDACKRGFLSGCRPVICLDGCHIKTKFGGQLLTAVRVDPNDCIYPIAMAVVEVESLVTWKWFLQTLVNDLGIDSISPWTIMTDKQKVSSYCWN
jgi:hypothetical protein